MTKPLNTLLTCFNLASLKTQYFQIKKRWVVIEPRESNKQGCKLLLSKASNDNQLKFVGNQSGGRVLLFLYTSDIDKFHNNLIVNSVEIVNGPRVETYGKVLVFKDLYGNLWDLIQPF